MKIQEGLSQIVSGMDLIEHRRKRRKAAAALLRMVIREEMQPRLAINRWPIIENADDENDLSIKIAMQALWHFEADEDRHHEELFYLDAQLELLKQMSTFLEQNRDFPDYMLTLYPLDHRPEFYRPHSLQDHRVATQVLRSAKSYLAYWKNAFKQILASIRPN